MTMLMSRQKGFFRYPGRECAEIRLFCFPFAGGHAQAFEDVADALPSGIEVVGVDYPGRRSRFGEPLIAQLDHLIDDLAAGIRPWLDRPFAFYGHSNGALVAFELARRLSRIYYRAPECLVLGAKRSPLLGPEEPLHRLPQDAFVARLRAYQGTPEQVLSCPDMMEVFTPILRADFALSETYCLTDRSPLSVPIHAIAGSRDGLATPEMMRAWAPLGSAGFALDTLEAGHFFLTSHATDLAAVIAAALSPGWAAVSPIKQNERTVPW